MVNKNAFNFFLKLVFLVMCFDKVIPEVQSDFDLIAMWDMLVGLDEGSSLEWLVSIVEVLCRCVSKEIIKRGSMIPSKSPYLMLLSVLNWLGKTVILLELIQ